MAEAGRRSTRDVCGGKYVMELNRMIGAGASGIVYRGCRRGNSDLPEVVAIKVVNPKHPDFRWDRTEHERRALVLAAGLPYVLRLLDYETLPVRFGAGEGSTVKLWIFVDLIICSAAGRSRISWSCRFCDRILRRR
jgi:hypothetical protein